MNSARKETQPNRITATCLTAAILVLLCAAVQAQAGLGNSSNESTSDSSESRSSASGSAAGSYATPSLGSSQNPFLGSVPEGKATGGVLQLSIKDAVDRALRNN